MKEINIAQVIIDKRREKGLTQEDLASYIGVSKASVSKWETGQSYPDITFLPQLATYFGISIDELMDYKPQMCKEDIRKLYLKLSADFAEKPFDEVLERCREIAKKYYSCFHLLFQIGALMVNNCMEANDKDKAFEVLEEAKALFVRVKMESEDAELCQLSASMVAFCALTLGNPNEVIELLEGASNKIISTEALLASAYQMAGKIKEAKFALQVGIYQHMMALFGDLPNYLMLCVDEPEQFDETYKRTQAIAYAFDLKHLHPSLLIKFQILAAQGYVMLGNTNSAIKILEDYTELVTGDISPLKLKGDGYFNLIDDWFDELDLGTALPRDEKTVRQSIVDSVVNNPIFTALSSEYRFQRITERLKNNLQEAYYESSSN